MTCQWDQTGPGEPACEQTGKEFYIEQTEEETGEKTKTLLGYLCPPHAMEWIRTHITTKKEIDNA